MDQTPVLFQQSQAMNELTVLDLGLREYREVWEFQKRLVAARAAEQISDTLILVEHLPVYTVGRGELYPQIALADVPVVEVERGGRMTFHGPGQLVGYPIMDLRLRGRDLHHYLRALEKLLILTLEDFGIAAEPRLTGVWTKAPFSQKIASIGIAVKHWISYHGFALNIATDLRYFRAIAPCGLDGSVMTSMSEHLKRSLSLAEVKPRLLTRFKQVFGFVEIPPADESAGSAGASVLKHADLTPSPFPTSPVPSP